MSSPLPGISLDEAPNPIDENQRALWCSVIWQAVDDFRGCSDQVDKDSVHHKPLRREDARRWLESDNTRPNSFLALCELLGLDAGSIRLRLFAEKNSAPRPQKERISMNEKKKCLIPDCECTSIISRGLCGLHYDRWRHNQPEMIEAMGGIFVPTRKPRPGTRRETEETPIAPASRVFKKILAKAKGLPPGRVESALNGRAESLAAEHWNYIRDLLVAHGEDGEPDILSKIEFHYKSAMIHGYKHGVADRERPPQS